MLHFILLSIILTSCQVYGDVPSTGDEYLNRCMSSKHHKKEPSTEVGVMKEHCKMHQSKSCCTWDTTEKIHTHEIYEGLFKMIIDQCPNIKNMSTTCRSRFQRDFCFYQCSPNLGPWIIPVANKKSYNESIFRVPLCASECDGWYNDCRDDYTCNDNWNMNWDWKKKGTVDMCPQTKTCKKFKEYFPNAKLFCENIFHPTFKYEEDVNNCMSFSDVSKNAEVAKKAAIERASQDQNHADEDFM